MGKAFILFVAMVNLGVSLERWDPVTCVRVVLWFVDVLYLAGSLIGDVFLD